MKIIFICGSLEPGQCGVGDYTRRLGGELIIQGHSVKIIAINDYHIPKSTETIQDLDGVSIKVLRLSAKESSNDRFHRAFPFINQFDPEWLSLQYVPYSFHKKGLPWKLSRSLLMIGKEVKWHFMFHELWLGMGKDSSSKNILIGMIQKVMIKNMIKTIAPICIHTQAPLYQAQIKKIGYKAEILPLFCNISPKTKSATLQGNLIHIAVFGTIQRNAKLADFVHWLLQNKNYSFHFHFIGGNGPEQDQWINILTLNKIPTTFHGWLKNAEVSEALGICQWGLSSTSYYLTKKSGSVAAMLAHELTVICIAGEWIPRNIDVNFLKSESVINWNSRMKIENMSLSKKQVSVQNIKHITKNFIRNLNTC